MSDEKSFLSAVKEVPQLLTIIYGDLAQPSLKAIGSTIGALLEYSTLWHLKIKLKNEREKVILQNQLDRFKEKISQVKEEDLCEVNPQIGVPIFERLAYTTNEDVAELFINLLAKASSSKTINQAHPAFIQAIERLSVDEAFIINYLAGKDFVPFANFQTGIKGSEGTITLQKHLTLIPFEIKLDFPENINMYTDNLQGLGILNIPFGLYKSNEEFYTAILEKNNFNQLRDSLINHPFYDNLKYERGFFQITDFGKKLINACSN